MTKIGRLSSNGDREAVVSQAGPQGLDFFVGASIVKAVKLMQLKMFVLFLFVFFLMKLEFMLSMLMWTGLPVRHLVRRLS